MLAASSIEICLYWQRHASNSAYTGCDIDQDLSGGTHPIPEQAHADGTNGDKMAIDPDTHCAVCARADMEERMLICDRCMGGWHMHCLNPPLTETPQADDWYCQHCSRTSSSGRAIRRNITMSAYV